MIGTLCGWLRRIFEDRSAECFLDRLDWTGPTPSDFLFYPGRHGSIGIKRKGAYVGPGPK